MTWPENVTSIIGALLTGGGLVAVVNAVANRRKTKVDAATELSDTALEMIREVRTDAMQQIELARQIAVSARRDAEDARRSAGQAWAEATEARREAVDMRREAMATAAQLRRLHAEIWSPIATVDGLRRLLDPGGSNGAHAYSGR